MYRLLPCRPCCMPCHIFIDVMWFVEINTHTHTNTRIYNIQLYTTKMSYVNLVFVVIVSNNNGKTTMHSRMKEKWMRTRKKALINIMRSLKGQLLRFQQQKYVDALCVYVCLSKCYNWFIHIIFYVDAKILQCKHVIKHMQFIVG